MEPLGEALKCLRTGDHDGARKQLEPILAAQPGHGPALALLGISLMLAGDLDEAVATLKQAVAVLPDDETTRINLGNALRAQAESRLKAGQLQEAHAGLLEALDQVPDDVQALLGLAQVEQELCHYEDALAAYEAYLDVEPQQARVHLSQGFCLQELRRLDEALQAYRTAIQLDRSLYAEVLKSLITASHGCLWLKPSELKSALGLTQPL